MARLCCDYRSIIGKIPEYLRIEYGLIGPKYLAGSLEDKSTCIYSALIASWASVQERTRQDLESLTAFLKLLLYIAEEVVKILCSITAAMFGLDIWPFWLSWIARSIGNGWIRKVIHIPLRKK